MSSRTSLRLCRAALMVAALAMAGGASAQTRSPEPAIAAPAPKAASQGVAVLASGPVRDEAFALARAVYGSSLRPRALDELRARILAGDPPPPWASREVRELAELRASITSEDAASRRLLASIAEQLRVEALLVVSAASSEAPEAPAPDAGGTTAGADVTTSPDGGAGPADAGAPAPARKASARLFLASAGEFDAARYEPDPGGGWRGTVRSLGPRFPPPAAPVTAQVPPPPPASLPSDAKPPSAFYKSPWFWGAIGATAILGALFWATTQDSGDDPIHLQMRVPR